MVNTLNGTYFVMRYMNAISNSDIENVYGVKTKRLYDDSIEKGLINENEVDYYDFVNSNGPNWELAYLEVSKEERTNQTIQDLAMLMLISYMAGEVIDMAFQETALIYEGVSTFGLSQAASMYWNGSLRTILQMQNMLAATDEDEKLIAQMLASTDEDERAIANALNGGKGETTNLYRVMSDKEYNSLMKNGKFTQYDNAMETKWFATNTEDANAWGKLFYPDSNYKMVEVTVPTRSLEDMYFVNKLDNIGPAFNAEREFINSVMEAFKEVIK